jgi:predicted enzyme related to lactoylglutathione lyase
MLGPGIEESAMAHNPVRWFEIYVQDMPRAKKFYESVFGVTLEKLGVDLDMWAFPGVPDQMGTPGALVRMPGVPSGGNSTLVYFGCDDCAAEARKAVESGGRIERAKMSIGQYGFVALVHDTEGNLIGLHSMT